MERDARRIGRGRDRGLRGLNILCVREASVELMTCEREEELTEEES